MNEPFRAQVERWALENAARQRDEIERSKKRDLELERDRVCLLPIPKLRNEVRPAPNVLLRSAVFGVVRHGKRIPVTDMLVAAQSGYEVSINGWRLDQRDLDIWLEIMYLASGSPPGSEIRFELQTLLRMLGYTNRAGKNDYLSIKIRLRQLEQTTVEFKTGQYQGVSGAFLANFEVDAVTKEVVCTTDPRLRPLFEDLTHLNIEQRRLLGKDQLAKALHAMLASHAEWMPMRLDTLRTRVGASETGRLRDFKKAVDGVLSDFASRRWIVSYAFQTNHNGVPKVTINKIQTPSQKRHVNRSRERV